jgi:hypothetical protein
LDYSWQRNRSRANVLAIFLAGVACPTIQFAFSQTQRSYSCYCRLPTGCLKIQIDLKQHKMTFTKIANKFFTKSAKDLRRLFFLIMSLGTSALVLGAPTAIRFQGSIAQTVFDWEGKALDLIINDTFTIDVDPSGKWLLTSKSTIHTNGTMVAGFDGTNMITVMYNDRVLTSKTSTNYFETADPAQKLHQATMSKGGYPYDVFPPSRVAWFAVASGLQQGAGVVNNGSHYAAPWLQPRNEILAFAFKANRKHASNWPYTLLSADFTANPNDLPKEPDGFLIPTDKSTFDQTEDQKQSAQKLIDGSKAASFITEGSRMFAGIEFPVAFSLNIYWPAVGVHVSNDHLAQRYVGSITNVERIDPVSGIPNAVGIITVRDFRLQHKDESTAFQEIRYSITNGTWRQIDHPEIQGSFSINKQRPRFGNMSNKILKACLLFILSCMVFGPIAYKLVKIGKSRSRPAIQVKLHKDSK